MFSKSYCFMVILVEIYPNESSKYLSETSYRINIEYSIVFKAEAIPIMMAAWRCNRELEPLIIDEDVFKV